MSVTGGAFTARALYSLIKFVPFTHELGESDEASYTMIKSTPRAGMINGRIGSVSPARLPSA